MNQKKIFIFWFNKKNLYGLHNYEFTPVNQYTFIPDSHVILEGK